MYEYLHFTASLKLPRADPSGNPPGGRTREDGPPNEEDIEAAVWRVIEELGLVKVAHSFIGDAFVRGLSGATVPLGSRVLGMKCSCIRR